MLPFTTMTAVLSPSSSPHPNQSPSPSAATSSLPPLVTNHPQKRSGLQRPPSYARNRMSSYSTASNPSQRPSRPPSHMFPIFHSSLPYALVRDFAYPSAHPLHFGPPAETSAAPSGRSTPANDLQRRLSDPPGASWEGAKSWSAGSWSGETERLPQMAYGEDHGDDHGPPYSEDEDLHSPIVISSRHKKTNSALPSIAGGLAKGRGKSPASSNGIEPSRQSSQGSERGYHKGVNGDGSETYYITDDDGTEQARYSTSMLFPTTYHSPRQAGPSNSRTSQYGDSPNNDNSNLEPGQFNTDESRYSRDYQFTIASPEEEMHGKAVALFDFARENENELPLIEGQVILVSYRHGQGWLVAEDPKTRESGLVPEEYVRLLRDIEGGWTSLNGELVSADDTGLLSPDPTGGPDSRSAITPTQETSSHGRSTRDSNGSNSGEKRAPVVSTFSTSSNDLNPYPHHLLSTHGQQPPQVVHYGSQSTTPTVMSPANVDKRAADGGQLKKTNSGQPSSAKRRKSSDVDESTEDDDDGEDEDSDSDHER